MSISWSKRKARLIKLLDSGEDEDAVALALDRILHGQSVIGKTCEPDSFGFIATDSDTYVSEDCQSRFAEVHR